MIAASTFSGVGGLDLGLARAGFDHAFFAELDPWRRDVLAAHWPGVRCYADVCDVAAGGAREHRRERVRIGGDAAAAACARGQGGAVDLLCGGFPCQDLSVAGRRRGLAGARSGLFHEFARIADAVRPRWVLLENVPGLLSSNDGRDMGTVIGVLADLGYGVAWRILDARYFGVPQRRRRVFIVGHLGSDDRSALHALCESCGGSAAPSPCTWQSVASRPGGSASYALTRGTRLGDGTEETLVVNALGAAQGGPDDNDAQAGHLVAFRAGVSAVRRLTPVECERLMGWPDGWTEPAGVKAPDSRRYAACGDGVVANVAEWIGRRIQTEDAAS